MTDIASPAPGTSWSFAYGSNMASRLLREHCPSASVVMQATLPNFQIEFRRYSQNLAGGISTIMPAPGGLVRGIVFEFPSSELAALDIYEGVDKGFYLREGYLVLGEDGAWHNAELYRVAKPEGPFPPSAVYLDIMLEGAAEQGLPADYIAGLEALRTGND
ncbi:MAG: gamma-glutamylcyclotransferase family protein [Alphaproteobacteria bacterium]|nr:gamma-glutamylcyclotransferase family protein [Alphaproteobacteria bacterium]